MSSLYQQLSIVMWINLLAYLGEPVQFINFYTLAAALFLYPLMGLIGDAHVISGVCMTAVLVSHCLFKHWMDSDYTTNPLKLIARVLHYARKHKYPENRSALTVRKRLPQFCEKCFHAIIIDLYSLSFECVTIILMYLPTQP